MRSINLQMGGNRVCATWDSFDCLAVSPAGFGDNIGSAIIDLIKNTPAYELNGIVTSIENAPQKTWELPTTVLAVAAPNTASRKCLCEMCKNAMCSGMSNSIGRRVSFTVHRCDGFTQP